jgi:hypothetical protein
MAIIIPALPYTLTNGTTADANQVMADLNDIVSGVNNNAAHNGPNSDITSLTGLTTPLTIAQGGTGVGAVGAAGTIPVSDGTAFAWSNTVNGPLTVTGAVALNGAPNNIKGVTDNSAAAAGNVGEYVTANATTGNIAAATVWNITSISLTAGDWDVWGHTQFNITTAAPNNIQTGVSLANNSLGIGGGGNTALSGSATWGTLTTLDTGLVRVSVSVTTPVYLNGYASPISAGNITLTGTIFARRVR